MRFVCRIVASTLLLMPMLIAGANGQGVENINMDRSRFFVDYAVFADSIDNRLDVFYKIFNDGLHYVKEGDKYVANYEVNVKVDGDDDEQITGKSIERQYVLDSYDLTHSGEGYLINQLSMSVPAGDFDLIVEFVDDNSKDKSTIETHFKSPDFKRGGDMSQVEFIQNVESVPEDSPFHKGEVVALPSVERSLDGETSKLGIYQELYLGDYIGDSVTYSYLIHENHDNFEIADSEGVLVTTKLTRLRKFIDVSELVPGEFRLQTKLTYRGRPIVERDAQFMLKWSLASLLKNDFPYAVRQLKYIISGKDKKKLLALPDSERVKGFEDWWASQDPDKSTPENELREEYYRRIRYADQYFSTPGRDGWETDRGMIYVQYGEPDDIDRHPFELDRRPYQIWRYYSQRRIFLFEDTKGDGDYQLQQPYDGDWRNIGNGLGP